MLLSNSFEKALSMLDQNMASIHTNNQSMATLSQDVKERLEVLVQVKEAISSASGVQDKILHIVQGAPNLFSSFWNKL
jgi:flagellar motility protein MotE (MotC chaperone)